MKIEYINDYIKGVELYHMRAYKKLNGDMPSQKLVPKHLPFYVRLGYEDTINGDYTIINL